MRNQRTRKILAGALVVVGLTLAAYLVARQAGISWNTPSCIHRDYESELVRKNGVNNLQLVDIRTSLDETDNQIRSEVIEQLAELVHYTGLNQARIKSRITVYGCGQPYLVRIGEAEVIEPNVGLLFGAAQVGRADIVTNLLAEGIPADARQLFGAGRTALMYAAAEGHLSTVETLLDAGADPNLQDQSGLTSLMVASSLGHTEIVKRLLSAGATVELRDSVGGTALQMAESRGHKEIVELLREKQ